MRELERFGLLMIPLVLVPVVLGMAYIVWDFSPFVACMVVLAGTVGLIAEGVVTLNKFVSSH